MSSNRKAKTQEQPLISPYQTALGTPQMIECFNQMDASLASIDKTTESIDRRLQSVDRKLFQLDDKMDVLVQNVDAGLTTMAGLLREILDRLPEQETRPVDKAEDWVEHAVALRNYNALFRRIKSAVERDVEKANNVANANLVVEQDTETRFLVAKESGILRDLCVAFDKRSGAIEVEGFSGRSAPKPFTVQQEWNSGKERMEAVIGGEEAERFPVDELWRVSRRAIGWLLW